MSAVGLGEAVESSAGGGAALAVPSPPGAELVLAPTPSDRPSAFAWPTTKVAAATKVAIAVLRPSLVNAMLPWAPSGDRELSQGSP